MTTESYKPAPEKNPETQDASMQHDAFIQEKISHFKENGREPDPYTEKMADREGKSLLRSATSTVRQTIITGMIGLSLLGGMPKDTRAESPQSDKGIREITPAKGAIDYAQARKALESQQIKLPPDSEMQKMGIDSRAVMYMSVALDTIKRVKTSITTLQVDLGVKETKLRSQKEPPNPDFREGVKKLTEDYKKFEKLVKAFRGFPGYSDISSELTSIQDALKRYREFIGEWDKKDPQVLEQILKVRSVITPLEAKERQSERLSGKEAELLTDARKRLKDLLGEEKETTKEEALEKAKRDATEFQKQMAGKAESLTGVPSVETLIERIDKLEKYIANTQYWSSILKNPADKETMARTIAEDKQRLEKLKNQLKEILNRQKKK